MTSAAPDPTSWRPDRTKTAEALNRARTVLDATSTAVKHLAAYYKSESNYAGTTFVDLVPNEPNRITPTDLLAATTLSVDVKPQAIRNFVNAADEISARLTALPPELRLEAVVDGETIEAMASLYELVKSSLRRSGSETSNAWVTASKICARKRPHLFPVRDNVVLELLGLPKNYPVDWPAFQALVGDRPLMARLDELVVEADTIPGVEVGDRDLRLRHLDVVLWMRATR